MYERDSHEHGSHEHDSCERDSHEHGTGFDRHHSYGTVPDPPGAGPRPRQEDG